MHGVPPASNPDISEANALLLRSLGPQSSYNCFPGRWNPAGQPVPPCAAPGSCTFLGNWSGASGEHFHTSSLTSPPGQHDVKARIIVKAEEFMNHRHDTLKRILKIIDLWKRAKSWLSCPFLWAQELGWACPCSSIHSHTRLTHVQLLSGAVSLPGTLVLFVSTLLC